MAQTSNTEAVAISPLKHLNGIPLGTTKTLGGLRAGQHALLQAAPQGLHLGRARHGHDGTTRLAAKRLVLHDDFCEISNALETVRLKSSQEHSYEVSIRMAVLLPSPIHFNANIIPSS